MPAINKRETALIRLFVSAYENGAWATDELRPLDEEIDGAVDGFVERKSDGSRLAIEHTLIQPFVDDRSDLAWFKKNFLTVHRDESLIVPGRITNVFVDVKPLRSNPALKGAPEIIHEWLRHHVRSLPLGRSEYQCSIRGTASISICAEVFTDQPSYPGVLVMPGRYYHEGTLGAMVEKALREKLPKLVNTVAEQRVLLFEREQMLLNELKILREVDARRSAFPDLAKVDQIWFAETIFYEKDKCAEFHLYESDKKVDSLTFLRGRLITKAHRGVATVVERI
jgi:hypothetical protein